METEKCPTCESSDFLEKKLILIGEIRKPENRMEKEGGRPSHQLFLDQIKEEYIRSGPSERFVDGLYCTRCDVGFVPYAMVIDSFKTEYKAWMEAHKAYLEKQKRWLK